MQAESMVTFLGICLAVVMVAALVLKFIVSVYMPFIDDRDYIRMEIVRSHGDERVHWMHELHRLYLRRVPLIGRYLARRYNKKRK